MSEGKDPAIKLFGKTIQLPDGALSQDAVSGDTGGGGDGDAACVKSEDRSSSTSSSSEVGEDRESDDNNKDPSNADKDENKSHSTVSEEITEANTPSKSTDNTKTPSPETESATTKASKSEEEQSDTSNNNNNNQEKTLKKPDKILPCPRCNSMDTKFCYYNNYNVNQPRHFCKNCQRYWTAGGTMRNVPVGAGRRKNKTSASQYRQITVTDSSLSLPMELNHTVLNPNGTVLQFGSDNTPLCESMASVLKIAEKGNFNKPEEIKIPVHNNDDIINKPSVNDMQSCHGFSPQVPCFPMYPWGPQMGPAFCPPGFPMPFYPPGPYWGCPVPVPVPGAYWVPPTANYHSAPPSGPISPTLGKHSRDENVKCAEVEKESETEKSLWVPKTLRIDDPDEAAKSSIWATLGIKKDGSAPVNRGGIFKAFESKKEEKENMMQETSAALQANPAALSRSLNFQESS